MIFEWFQEKTARLKPDKKFEKLVREDLSFLFAEHGAEVVSNVIYSQYFGAPELIIAVGNLEFRLSTDPREEGMEVLIGPRGRRGAWERVPVALAASTGEDPAPLRLQYRYFGGKEPWVTGLKSLAAQLRPRLERLHHAFSEENYADTQARCAQIERELKRLEI